MPDEAIQKPVPAARLERVTEELRTVAKIVNRMGVDPPPQPGRAALLEIRLQLQGLAHDLGPDIMQRVGPGTPGDDGAEAGIMLGVQQGQVIFRFPKDSSWVAFTPETAREFAKGVTAAALAAESGG